MAAEKNNKTLNVPNLRFPEFSGEWEKCTLGSIGETFNGLTGKSAADFGSGSPYITYKSIFDNSKIDISKVEYVKITETERVNQTQNEVEYGDIFFTTSSETPEEVGMASVLLSEIRDCYLNSFCFGYRLFDKCIHQPDFFRFYLRSSNLRKKIAILAQGSTRFNISKNEVMKMPIFLPSLAEQRKISKILSLIEDRIETQKKIIEKYESLIKGITDKVFHASNVDFLRSFEMLYKDAGEGGTPSTSNPQYYENGTIPFIKIDDLSQKYLVAHKDCITQVGLRNSSAWLIPAGSVIYSNGATIGAISINTYPVSTKQGILGIVPNDSVCAEYLYYLMTSKYFRKQVHRIITEGTMKTAYLKDINKILCPVPNIDEQQRLAKSISSVTRKIETEKATLDAFILQKRYLLSHLFI